MKNYVSTGEVIKAPAPAACKSGDGILIGALFGVAQKDYDTGADGDFVTRGAFTFACASTETFAIGDKVYWKASTKTVTRTASGNVPIGVAISIVTTGQTTVDVRLDGVATAAA